MPTTASYIDRSGTITSGGNAQTISAIGNVRHGFFVQNLSEGDIYVDVGATAVIGQPSIQIIPGALYESPPNAAPQGLISIIGATTGQAFTAKEW